MRFCDYCNKNKEDVKDINYHLHYEENLTPDIKDVLRRKPDICEICWTRVIMHCTAIMKEISMKYERRVARLRKRRQDELFRVIEKDIEEWNRDLLK